MVSICFVESVMDQCIYHKVSESKIIFLVFYVDDILLATNDLGLLHEVKQFLFEHFYMKDVGEASYVIGIKIHKDRSQGLLGLSQETCINKVFKRFWMKDCSLNVTPIVKGDRFSLKQCSKNDLEREGMKNIPYALVVGSLMYAQICIRPNVMTRNTHRAHDNHRDVPIGTHLPSTLSRPRKALGFTPNITFVVGMLGSYQSNQGLDHWKAANKVMRYLQGTKDFILTYSLSNNLEVVGYSDSDLLVVLTFVNQNLDKSLYLLEYLYLGEVQCNL
ncbi:Gag-protease-integrase-RT-RNaseH polyprotein, putative [Theobroma cacao]|uniref:Gag-protease-integrase-RT-RNaseH polyprotein, putative n=1 Tax=Theobroma cacao TaxID=3641 RepID=A0A061FA26_THECC|nr:Gag-protease-integrase-RT-RNaseH polyprotein, putative [Theobroma cacao]